MFARQSNVLASKLVPLLSEALKGVTGLAGDVLADDAKYEQYVITPMWLLMPLPVRLLGRKRVRWDEFFLLLRRQAFEVRDGRVVLRDDLAQCMAKIVTSMFRGGDTAAVPPPGEPAPQPPHLPPQYHPGPAPLPAPPPVVIVAVPPPPPAGPPIAVGIDLGTTYSVVAHLDGQGRPWSIPNAAGDILTPSVVLFEEGGGVVVGREAARAAAAEPERVADLVKRDMGAKWYRKKIDGEAVPPEVISAAILSSLRVDAERKLGPVSKAVITVPAYFDEPRRRATMDAGRMAGLDVLDILNEPTAAAICYGYQLGFLNRYGAHTGPSPLRVLVYDLGGGTFDVTIVEIRGASFRAVATDGDVRLGGKDWDQHLIDLAAEQFRRQHREDPRTHPASLAELAAAAEEAKRTLTERAKATMYVNHLGLRSKAEVARAEFEAATAPLLARTRMTCEIVVRDAGLTWADIDRVILVGGSSRMPQVARMLEEVSGRKPDLSLSLDEAVAHGAALYADLLMQSGQTAGGTARFTVANVSSHALGMVSVDPRTGAERNTILLAKNAPLPASVTKLFKTYKPGQRLVKLRILEGDAERPEECTAVGVCQVRNLPPGLPAGTPVRVTYTYGTNGRLRVEATVEGVANVVTEFSRDTAVSETDMGMWSAFVASAALPE